MSLPQDDFHQTTYSSFDDPTFDESLLYEDFCLPQKPLSPHSLQTIATHQRKRDQLFQDIHQLDEDFNNTNHNHLRESLLDPEQVQNQHHPFKSLDNLDVLQHPHMDNHQATLDDEYTCPDHSQHHLLSRDISTSVNVNQSNIAEEPVVPNSETVPKLDSFNQLDETQISTADALIHQPQTPLFSHTQQPEDHNITDVESANITMAELNAVIDRHVHETKLQERQETIARKHPLEICEGTITPQLFPDILNPISIEEDTTHIETTHNTAELPPPRRQRGESLTTNTFSKPEHQSIQRPFVSLQSSRHQSSGTERPRKRTRTRIEDMDPSMVHVCNFPGCTKKFAKKYNLKIHQRRHNGDLPFLCEYAGCAKRFMWLSSFSRHLRVHASRRNGGRRRREHLESGDPHNCESGLEREPDIAISDDFAIFSISGVKLFIENELSQEVTFACALTALDSKPCDTLIPVAQIAQAKRQQLLFTARSEEFCQQQAKPYDMDNALTQNLRQLLSVHPDRMIEDSNSIY